MMKTQFLSSAAHFKDLPEPSLPEYAILGRSNVGKSSFINHVLEDKSLARTSKRPGKTSLANLYRIDQSMIWVDLPGYGYAKVSADEKARWSKLISDYCLRRDSLRGILWLIDIRHIGIAADIEAAQWLSKIDVPIFVVLTKADKLTRKQRLDQFERAKIFTNCPCDPTIYSVNEHESRKNFWGHFETWQNFIDSEMTE
jgi:GTP-binding protein